MLPLGSIHCPSIRSAGQWAVIKHRFSEHQLLSTTSEMPKKGTLEKLFFSAAGHDWFCRPSGSIVTSIGRPEKLAAGRSSGSSMAAIVPPARRMFFTPCKEVPAAQSATEVDHAGEYQYLLHPRLVSRDYVGVRSDQPVTSPEFCRSLKAGIFTDSSSQCEGILAGSFQQAIMTKVCALTQALDKAL